MVYTKENQLYYLTAQPEGDYYYDLYNFTTMLRNNNAYKDLMNANFIFLALTKTSPEKNDRYYLVVDFLANKKTEHISAAINNIVEYFATKEFVLTNTDEPLRLTIDNLKIEDVLNIIQDVRFQTINTILATTNSSIWKLYKK